MRQSVKLLPYHLRKLKTHMQIIAVVQTRECQQHDKWRRDYQNTLLAPENTAPNIEIIEDANVNILGRFVLIRAIVSHGN